MALTVDNLVPGQRVRVFGLQVRHLLPGRSTSVAMVLGGERGRSWAVDSKQTGVNTKRRCFVGCKSADPALVVLYGAGQLCCWLDVYPDSTP